MPNGNFDIVLNGNFDSDNPVPNGKPNSNTDSFNLVHNGTSDIVLNGNFDSDNPVSNGKSDRNTDLFNLVPNGNFDIVPNVNFNSDNPVLDGNVFSHSIKPPDNIVTCSIIDKSDLSFPSASIRTVNGIDFTFHSHFYFDMQRWISSLLPLLRLIISSFQLDYLLLFSRHDFPSCIDLRPSLTILQLSFPTWHISTHSLSSSNFGIKHSCYRSLIHGSSRHLLSNSSFDPDYTPEFPDATPWMSYIFNSLPFSLFTVDNISPSTTSPSSSIPFYQLFLQNFIKHNEPLDLQVDTSIINPHHAIPEPQLLSSGSV